MENILITGADGQLGSEFKWLGKKHPEYNYFFTDVNELDITSQEEVEAFIAEHSVTKIINCAAYNDVNGAESHSEEAVRINITGPQTLARAALDHDIYLIHFSSDYVFSGESSVPYREASRPSPISVYGRTKLAGELAVKQSRCKSIILRTSWLYSSFGNNFVKKILHLANWQEEIEVTDDAFGTPTYARDLAAAVFHILPQLSERDRYGEVYHYSNEGKCTWAEFAAKIITLKKLDCDILGIHTRSEAVIRPAYSVLDKSLIRTTFGVSVPHWEKSLAKAIALFPNDL